MQVTVNKIPQMDLLIIKQEGAGFFIAAPNVFIIDVTNLTCLLKFMVDNGYYDPKILEGILEEIRS